MTLRNILASDALQVAIFVAILAIAILLYRGFWRLLSRWLGGHEGLLWRMAAQLRRPVRLTLLVLLAAVCVRILSLPPGFERWLAPVARAALVVAAGWVVLVLANYLTERSISRVSLEEEDYGARSHATQLRVLQKVAQILIVLLTGGLVLSTFESVRTFGLSLFASAGAAGLVLGFAARPVLANLIAGIQIALTQPIRLNDVVIVEDEWGWIEEIRATYVIIRIWDLRRLVVPLSYFIEQPFQNWTRDFELHHRRRHLASGLDGAGRGDARAADRAARGISGLGPQDSRSPGGRDLPRHGAGPRPDERAQRPSRVGSALRNPRKDDRLAAAHPSRMPAAHSRGDHRRRAGGGGAVAGRRGLGPRPPHGRRKIH